MDLLGSRRGNIVRLQMGLGLPVRDLEENGRPQAELWTPLVNQHGSVPSTRVKYLDLRNLGAYDGWDKQGRKHLSWLWRSLIARYDRHARIWQRWLCRLYSDWLPTVRGRGFALYDQETLASLEWDEFRARCDGLIDTLGRVSVIEDMQSPGRP